MRDLRELSISLELWPQCIPPSFCYASQEEWEAIVRAGLNREIMLVSDPGKVPCDGQGRPIYCGARGVKKVKVEMINDEPVTRRLQRFIIIGTPINTRMRRPAPQTDTLPFVGQLLTIGVDEGEVLVMDSAGLTNNLNLMALNEEWSSWFTDEQKITKRRISTCQRGLG